MQDHINFILSTLATLNALPTFLLAIRKNNIHFVFLIVYWMFHTIAHHYFQFYSVTKLFLTLDEVQKQTEISTTLIIVSHNMR